MKHDWSERGYRVNQKMRVKNKIALWNRLSVSFGKRFPGSG